jgi:hypothetical protein
MKRELLIYFGLFLFLAIGMHFEQWTSHPVDHLLSLPHAVAYGLGPEHPFVFTLVLYIIIGIPRVLKKLFTRKKEKNYFSEKN